MPTRSWTWVLCSVLGVSLACDDEDAGGAGAGDVAADSTSDAVADTGASTDGGTEVGANGCGAQVVIAFYPDDTCTPGTEMGRRTYDTSQECFSWTAEGSNAGENSATRFQCYRDRICYTQHPQTLTCEGGMGPTDKEARTDQCLAEPAGTLFSHVLSGTEGCPEAPEGFACPTSEANGGSDAIAACGSF